MTDGERFDVLVEKYLDGALDGPERPELRTMLSASSDRRAEFVRRLTQEAAIKAVTQERRLVRAPKRAPRAPRPESRRVGWAVAAAAGLLLLLLAAALRKPDVPAPRMARKSPPTPREVVPPREEPSPAATERPRPPRAPQPAPSAPELPKPAPAAVPPPVVPPPAPAPRPAPVETRVAVAAIERLEGDVHVVKGPERVAARPGRTLEAGETLETGLGGRVLTRYADGTRVVLEPAGSFTCARNVTLTRGTLTADVARQPKGQAFVLATAHAEVRVLGTRLTLVESPTATRVEVETGAVRCTRLADGRTLDVTAGHYAVVGVGVLPTARPLFGPNLIPNPDFEGADPKWLKILNPTMGGTFGGRSVVSSPARGARALRMTADRQLEREVFQDLPVKAGDTFQIEAWLQTEALGGAGAEVTLVWLPGPPNGADTIALEAQGTVIRTDVAGTQSGTREWARLEARFTSPPRSRVVRVRLVLQREPDNDGKAWFDDVTLRKVH